MTHNLQNIPMFPAPPRPPREGWTPAYGNELTRWLQNISEHFDDFTYGRFNGLLLLSFPTSGYDLRVGEVFSNGGVLTVVRENDIWAGGFAVTTELGSLTVTV